MVTADDSSDDTRPDPHATPLPGGALEHWTTPTVRVLAVSETRGGDMEGPEEGFYGPQS